MYFNTMPLMTYRTPDGKDKKVRDIFNRVAFKSTIRGRLSLYPYEIQLGDTPEIIAQRVYQNPQYHWLVLLVNEITNPYEEWPKDFEQLETFVKGKYGAGNENAVHHYSIVDSEPELIVDYDAAKIASGEHRAVTNYDYEIELNDEKRKIFLLRNEFVGEFVTQYKKLMKSQNAR